jgi:lysophospholipase L1-like esterase
MRHSDRGVRRRGALAGLLLLLVGCAAPPKLSVPAREHEGLTRVACVGDSITAGAGLKNPAESSYPAVLAKMLGDAYAVRNFGVSGATMLKEGDLPYTSTPAYKEALAYAPNVVVIALGTNDSKPQNWRFGGAFERDVYSIVRAFRALPTHPRVYICSPPPVFQDRWGITGDIVKDQITPTLRRICAREIWPMIDLQVAMRNSADYFPDGVHPDEIGAASIASSVEAAFRGR